VVEGEDDREPYATELRDRFVAWLTLNRPELGITSETEWSGTMVSPRWLVVSHYLFFSEDWEMHVSWHIMVPPYDWARIDLRHRFDEETPSYAFEISSVDASTRICVALRYVTMRPLESTVPQLYFGEGLLALYQSYNVYPRASKIRYMIRVNKLEKPKLSTYNMDYTRSHPILSN